jgi:hypothetical protein
MMKIKIDSPLLVILFFLMFSSDSSAQSGSARGFLFFTKEEIVKIKNEVAAGNQEIIFYSERLKRNAEIVMKRGPWSVTFTPSPVASGNPHDYFSESPYWWPDPSDPKKPYIRRDGERNPDRFDTHRRDLEMMSQSVLTLSAASYFFNSSKYADRAIELINVWFLDEKTKMNPHLQYAQAIRNRSDGRGVGIIDSRALIYVLEGVNFLKVSEMWNNELDTKLNDWYRSYLKWLTESKNGLDEKKGGNNHSTWWSFQVASIADFLNEKGLLEMVWDFLKNELIENQIEADGSQPKEEARTNSLSYSFFNLDAYSMVFRLGQMNSLNLWEYKNSKGGSVIESIEYILPFLKEPSGWKKQQISPLEITERRFLPLAGFGTGNKEYIIIHKEIMKKTKSKNDISEPFMLLLDMNLLVTYPN